MEGKYCLQLGGNTGPNWLKTAGSWEHSEESTGFKYNGNLQN
jgi:hypothetical protein